MTSSFNPPKTEVHQPIFSRDWFDAVMHISQWNKILAEFREKPKLKFLEIGVFEGKATHWLLTNILTDPSSRIVCIDTFQGGMEHRPGERHAVEKIDSLYDLFIHNTSPFREKIILQMGLSQELLRQHKLNSYDFIYIDGSHSSPDVLEDAVLCFRLLKTKGIMIFDDYEWKEYDEILNNPGTGIDAFLNVYEGQYALIFKGCQVVVRKN